MPDADLIDALLKSDPLEGLGFPIEARCEKCGKRFTPWEKERLCSECACPDCGTTLEIGMWCFPCKGTGDHALGPMFKGDHAIHPSERVTLIRNPSTGETRIPGRADRPIHPKYLAAGFTERVQLEQHSEVRALEREKGLLHESSNYNQNSVTAERDTNSH